MPPMIPDDKDYVAGKLVKFRHSEARRTVVSGRDTLGASWVINYGLIPSERVFVFIGTTGLIIDKPKQWKTSMSGDCVVLVGEKLIIATIRELDLVDPSEEKS